MDENKIHNIRILNSNPYYDMRRPALYTVGLKPKKGDAFNKAWLKRLLISRHTPIRTVLIEFEFETTKAVRDQLLRSKHGWVEPYVTSARPDRVGEPRDPNALSKYLMVFNIEGLMKMCADRLCSQTESATRKLINDLKRALMNSEDEILSTIGEILAPKCCWYGACNEFKSKNCFEMNEYSSLNIEDRIQVYTGTMFNEEER